MTATYFWIHEYEIQTSKRTEKHGQTKSQPAFLNHATRTTVDDRK